MSDADREAPRRPWLLRLIGGLALDVGLWLGVYYLVLALGESLIVALIAAGGVALLRALYVGIRTRAVDAFLSIVVLSFLVSVLLSLLTGDPRMLLWKGVVMTGVWGAATLTTLRVGKPLLFSITQRLLAPGMEGRREWLRLWETSTPFRWLYRRLTLVWGVTFLCFAAAQAILILTVPVDLAAPALSAASPLVSIGLIGWTIWYSQRAERSLDRPLDDAEARAAAAAHTRDIR
ncbi:hypothetical protein PFZ55_40175 [Streptomyces sp. MS2A]|nr:hypothetical protein [Streptomyces sp. MS2A]